MYLQLSIVVALYDTAVRFVSATAFDLLHIFIQIFSLNNATELLQRHCGDLENSLKLRIQEAEIQR